MSKTLFDQLSEVERGAVAGIIGGTDCAGFRINLREIPAIAEPFVMGAAARAYLTARLAALNVPVEGDAPKDGSLKMTVLNIDGTNWLVREATSRAEAENAIAYARVTGSVGSKHSESNGAGVTTKSADVVRLHPDGRECLPYGEKGEDYSALVAAAGSAA